jgi:hypothetical protein
MLTNIIDSSPDDISIGAPVRVKFVEVSDTVTLPCFALDIQPHRESQS